jgi:hypothetical protein
MRKITIALLLGLLLAPAMLYAKDVAGIKIAETRTLSGSSQKLILNGAGIRKKFFVKVYIGSLYLSKPAHSLEAVLKQTGPAAVHMHFLHSKVSKEKLVNGWNDGFSSNTAASAMASLKPRIEKFNSLFRTVKKGEVIRLDYIPGKGTHVLIQGEKMGVISGKDFWHAVLKIWLGSKPADSKLKKAMLGQK